MQRSTSYALALFAVLLALAAAPLAAQEEQAAEKVKEMAAQEAEEMMQEKAAEMPQPPEMPEEMRAMMEAWQKAGTPGDAHAELASMAGTWTFTIKSWMDPANEPMVSTGTAERSMILGGRVLHEKVVSEMMGQKFEGIGVSGYDNVSGQYWSAWMDSMSTGCYVMHGSKDEATGDVVFDGEMEDPMRGTVAIRSVVKQEADGKQMMEWHEKRGEEMVKTMEIVYVRQ